jgi:hypothetical protein
VPAGFFVLPPLVVGEDVVVAVVVGDAVVVLQLVSHGMHTVGEDVGVGVVGGCLPGFVGEGEVADGEVGVLLGVVGGVVGGGVVAVGVGVGAPGSFCAEPSFWAAGKPGSAVLPSTAFM